MLENVRFTKGSTPLEDAAVKAAIADGEARLAASGRLLIRKSGTEPLIRVMGESEDADLLKDVVMGIAGTIAKL
jgi:phosphoglucosamine mutase